MTNIAIYSYKKDDKEYFSSTLPEGIDKYIMFQRYTAAPGKLLVNSKGLQASVMEVLPDEIIYEIDIPQNNEQEEEVEQ